MLDEILDFISDAIEQVVEWVTTVINGIINFFKDIVGFFRNLCLDPKKQVPFIADTRKLKGMLKNAPVKNVGVFTAVYNEETDQVEHAQVIDAEGLDQKTRETLGNEEIVVLS